MDKGASDKSDRATAALHTPGPWEAKWSKYREGEFIVQAAFPSNRVLAVFDGDGRGPDEQEIASAHLISAAPDMFDALTKLRQALDLIDPSRPLQYANAMELMRQRADAALAKASPTASKGDTP